MRYLKSGLSLDEVQYHCVNTDDVPPGWAAVPGQVDDNGHESKASMMAGSVGIRASSSGELTADGNVGKDTLRSEVGWWMMTVKAESEKVERENWREGAPGRALGEAQKRY